MLAEFMSLPSHFGVLLVGHGTVQSVEELPDFLLAIRRGRPPGAELIAEMRHRYEAIGGSPLLKVTESQGHALSRMLSCPVYVGMRFCQPSVEAAFRLALSEGIEWLSVVSMAPYNALAYTDEATRRIQALAPETGSKIRLLNVPAWGNVPELVQAHVDNIRTHAQKELASGAKLFLTAHSLPMRVINSGDPYGILTATAATSIGQSLGLDYELCYQSVGADGGDWLGPSLSERIALAAQNGVKSVVVVPFGFLCDHVETLYDLDIELRAQTNALNVELTRVPALGVHPGLIQTLASLVNTSWSRREDPIDFAREGNPV
jgi:ferrochelatase